MAAFALAAVFAPARTVRTRPGCAPPACCGAVGATALLSAWPAVGRWGRCGRGVDWGRSLACAFWAAGAIGRLEGAGVVVDAFTFGRTGWRDCVFGAGAACCGG
ncbi:MAG: hypothetical protein ACPGOY_11845 [Rhodospirillaceae bacterium]